MEGFGELWNGTHHTVDIVLSRANEDGQARLAALELDDGRVACGHALEGAVLHSIRVLRLDLDSCYDYRTVNCSFRSVIDTS